MFPPEPHRAYSNPALSPRRGVSFFAEPASYFESAEGEMITKLNYFDFRDRYRVTDQQGERCQTLDDAKEFARQFAGELAESRQAIGMAAEVVVVVDESGREVFRTPLVNGSQK